MLEFKVRSARDEDFNFVADSYRHSLRAGSDLDWLGSEGGRLYHRELDRRLPVMSKHCWVAEGEGTLLGWASGEDVWLHYVYVKQPYREAGVGRQLAHHNGALTRATHWTRSSAIYLPKLKYWPTYWKERR